MAIERIHDVDVARRYIFFDFDGTLADTMPGIIATAQTTLAEYGLTKEEMGDLRRIVGPPFPKAFSDFFGVSEQDAIGITERYRKRYRQLGPKGWPPFDGISDMLLHLREQGKVLAVVSAKSHPVLEMCVSDCGFMPLFDSVLGKIHDTGFTKVEALAQVMDDFSCDASECVMVGDREGDVFAASAVDIPCIGVSYGGAGTREELVSAGAALIVDSVSELESVLLGV